MRYKVIEVKPKYPEEYEIHYSVWDADSLLDDDLVITLSLANVPVQYVSDVVKYAIRSQYERIRMSGVIPRLIENMEFSDPEREKMYG